MNSNYGERSLGTNLAAQFESTIKKAGKTGNSDQSVTLNESVAMETSMMQHRTAHSNLPPYLVNSQTIKPSVSFIGLARNDVKLKHYVDLQDGPSSLQHRPGIPTFKEKFDQPTVFETERKQFDETKTNNIQMLENAR